MNYKLAKQLIESGFLHQWSAEEHKSYKKGGDFIFPTLSELIEACGKGVILFQDGEKHLAAIFGHNGTGHYGDSWIDDSLIDLCEGSTFEEALSKLWLELNPKVAKP